MSKHTPGPWETSPSGDNFVCTSDMEEIICVCEGDQKSENARLIVACVNACEGINPEIIPLLIKAVQLEDGWRKATTQKQQDQMRIWACDAREKVIELMEGEEK